MTSSTPPPPDVPAPPGPSPSSASPEVGALPSPPLPGAGAGTTGGSPAPSGSELTGHLPSGPAAPGGSDPSNLIGRPPGDPAAPGGSDPSNLIGRPPGDPAAPGGSDPSDLTERRAPAGPGSLAPPDQMAVFLAVYRLLLRSVATTGRLVAIGALAVVSILTAVAVNAGQVFDRLDAATGYVSGNVSTLVPVAVLVFGSAALGDVIEDGSLVYLWLRPVPARVHVLAAWAATMTITVPLVGAPVVLAAAIIDADGTLMGAAALALLLGIATYAALFVMAGIRFRRALPWGLAYILIWEGFVASAGETAARLAVRSYLRSILSQLTDQRLKLGDFSLPTAIIVPVLVTIAALAYASHRLARTDVP